VQGALGRLTARHLPGGPVGLPARWAATLTVVGSGTAEGAKGLLAREGGRDPRVRIVTPLLV